MAAAVRMDLMMSREGTAVAAAAQPSQCRCADE